MMLLQVKIKYMQELMNRCKKRLIALVLSLVFAAVSVLSYSEPAYAIEEFTHGENIRASVNGSDNDITIKALHYVYPNNRYVSMRDVAAAISGTDKQFEMAKDGDKLAVTLGVPYGAVGGENVPFELPEEKPADEETEEPEITEFKYRTKNMGLNAMEVNGKTVKYYTFIGDNMAGKQDYYISISDLAMLLDLNMEFRGERLYIDTSSSYVPNIDKLREEGFYYEVHAALVGDATTGEIYDEYNPDNPVAIASVTKLMTYLCIMDAISSGRIGANDEVVITKQAEELSNGEDGVIKMEEGQVSSVSELIKGMLLPSSNESALSLAIHVAGSEEAFVELMNAKARELGLSDKTVFYNPHGLPGFMDSVAASKHQNRMTVEDAFKMVQYILAVYPGIKDVTSLQKTELPTFNRVINNTNPLLYNMDEVVGLKTGTTIMAGACLVAAADVKGADGSVHTIVAMEFGAEDFATRNTLTQELMVYGINRFRENAGEPLDTGAEIKIPQTAEEFIRAVIAEAK